MIENKENKINTGKEQKRMGKQYSPRNKLVRGGRIEVDSFALKDSGVTIRNYAVPESGVGGIVIEHDTQRIAFFINGSGEGLGTRVAGISNSDGSVAFYLEDHDDGNYSIVMTGLPTSNPGGSGRLWKNGNAINIT